MVVFSMREFKGDVKILDNNSDPRLLIGDSTANEYGEISYDSSENDLDLVYKVMKIQ